MLVLLQLDFASLLPLLASPFSQLLSRFDKSSHVCWELLFILVNEYLNVRRKDFVAVILDVDFECKTLGFFYIFKVIFMSRSR